MGERVSGMLGWAGGDEGRPEAAGEPEEGRSQGGRSVFEVVGRALIEDGAPRAGTTRSVVGARNRVGFGGLSRCQAGVATPSDAVSSPS
jgi:hypothetical protein